jgi:hypothetical protein
MSNHPLQTPTRQAPTPVPPGGWLAVYCFRTGRDVVRVHRDIARQKAEQKRRLIIQSVLTPEPLAPSSAGFGSELAQVRHDVEQLRQETVEAIQRLAGRLSR